jgi:cell division protein FtsB
MDKNEMYTEYGYRGTAELQQEKDRNKKLVEENKELVEENKKLVEANEKLTENLRKSEEHYTT